MLLKLSSTSCSWSERFIASTGREVPRCPILGPLPNRNRARPHSRSSRLITSAIILHFKDYRDIVSWISPVAKTLSKATVSRELAMVSTGAWEIAKDSHLGFFFTCPPCISSLLALLSPPQQLTQTGQATATGFQEVIDK